MAGVGAVPSHWEVTRLKLECDVFPSNVDKKSADGEQAVRLCNYTDVYYNDLITAEMPFMEATASDEQIASFTLRAGDTIITKDSESPDDIARSTYVPTDLPGVVCGYHLSMVRPNHRSHGAFIKRYFDTASSRAYFHVSANGLTRVGLGQYAIDNAPIVLPPLAEQIAIAAFLDRETAKIDSLVAEQERLIALLREKRQAVISHAVTKGLNPNAPMKDSGIEWLGQIPAHWKIQRAKNLFGKSSLPPPADAEVVTCFRDGQVTLRRNRREGGFTFAVLEVGYQGIRPGQLVLHSMDAFAGAIGVCDSDGKCSPEYIVCDPVDQRAMPDYYGQLLRLMALRGFILAICPSVRERAPRIRFPDVSDMILPIPPFGEQEAIVSALQASDDQTEKLISASSQAISLLQERRAALISAAVTGQIDVRGEVSHSNVVSIDTARLSNLSPLRAVVGAYAIRELGPMGRMAVMKAGFLAEGHAGFGDLNGRYERYAAGPYDQSLISAMERGAGEICAIVTNEPKGEGKPVAYDVPKGCQPPSDALPALVGKDRARRFLALLSLLKSIGRDGVEASATLYAVWNDLLAAGKAVDDDAICNGVLNDWHPEKARKFKRADLDHWLDWMRRNNLVPDGSAPRTDSQGSLFG